MPFVMNGIDQRTVDLVLRPQSPAPTDSYSLTGRTAVDPSTIPTLGTINIVFIGQSHNANSISGGTYTPTDASLVTNLSIGHAGGCWQAKSPLLIDDGVGDHHGRWLADQLIAAGLASRVILTLISASATFGVDWAPGGGTYGGGTRTGTLGYRIGLAARCIAKAGLDRIRRIVDLEIGHSDSALGTTEANFTTALNGIINECKTTGLLRASSDVMFVHKSTSLAASSGNRNAIRAAQAAVADGTLVRVGADSDSLDSSYRYDGVHFSYASGASAQANLKKIVYDTWL